MQMLRRTTFLLALGLAASGFFLWCTYQVFRPDYEALSAPYVDQLRLFAVREHVIVGGKLYTVNQGDVSGPPSGVSPRERFDALRIAYALTMARRAPLVAIPGTNPGEILATVEQFRYLAEELAEIQEGRREQALVRNALFPVEFLRRVALSEQARLRFIETGSDADTIAWQKAQLVALAAFQRDLARFESAFRKVVSPDVNAYQVFSGKVTYDSTLRSIASLRAGAVQVKNTVIDRSRCISGNFEWCSPEEELSYPVVQAIEEPTTTYSPYANEVPGALAANTRPDYITNPRVELTQSACFSSLGMRPLFTLVERDNWLRYDREPVFIGDAVFVDAKQQGTPFYSYFLEHGMRYVYYPVFETYKCPELLADVSNTMFVANVQKLARGETLSQYASGPLATELTRLERRLSANLMQEYDAREYISTSMMLVQSETRIPRKTIQTVLDLTLAANYRSSGIDHLMRRTIKNEIDDVILKKKGVPVEMRTPYLFYIRSGFYSLFLATNPSLAGVQNPPVDSVSDPLEGSPFHLYSQLRPNVSREVLVDALTAFQNLHRAAALEMRGQ